MPNRPVSVIPDELSQARVATHGGPRFQPWVLPARLFWPLNTGLVACCMLVVGYYGRRVFLWSDDYVFLLDAYRVPLSLDLLKSPLFGHFSPVSQLVDSLVSADLPTHPWLIRAILLLLSLVVVASTAFLMISLFDRTWLTLIGTALGAPALSLLPPVNWWTAGLNMMPAFAGLALCLGAMVRLVRGGTRWWALLAIGSFVGAIMSLELGVTAIGYALVWALLFRSRVSTEPWLQLLRRTWWVWVALGALAVWSVLNYKINYYQPTPAPSLPLALDALGTSLVTVQLPLTLGFYDPSRAWFQLLGIALGAAAGVALIVVTLLRSRRAWRGWAFALLGWLIPVTAVVLSRVGYIGVRAVEQPMYYYLPTLLFLIGALEAWAAPWVWQRRHEPEASVPTGRPPRRGTLAAGAVAAVAFAAAWQSSAWPTIASTNYGMIGSPNTPFRNYMTNLVDSAHTLQASGAPFSVINGVAPEGLLNFQGHNRLSQVTGVHDPSIPFDAPDGPWYVPDETGTLVPATIQWQAELTAPAVGLATNGTTAMNGGPGLCFTVDTPDAALRWDLPAPVAGGAPVVRTMATVAAATPVRVSTVTNPGDPPVVTNVNPRTWTPDETGRLDTTAEPQISSVVIDSMTVGTSMCLTSIQVGTVSAS